MQIVVAAAIIAVSQRSAMHAVGAPVGATHEAVVGVAVGVVVVVVIGVAAMIRSVLCVIVFSFFESECGPIVHSRNMHRHHA